MKLWPNKARWVITRRVVSQPYSLLPDRLYYNANVEVKTRASEMVSDPFLRRELVEAAIPLLRREPE